MTLAGTEYEEGRAAVAAYTQHARHNALALASIGVHVFPVGLKPLYRTEHGWKLKKRYFKGIDWGDAATTKRKQIKQWWSEYPRAAVGIATGPSRIAVIDRDSLTTDLGVLPETFTYPTARGGQHRLYAPPEGVDVRSADLRDTDGRAYADTDIKAWGGMVVFYVDRPLTDDDLEAIKARAELPARFAVSRESASGGVSVSTGSAASIVDEWLESLDDSPAYGSTLQRLVEAVPTSGESNATSMQFIGPLVRGCFDRRAPGDAAWIAGWKAPSPAPGGRMSAR